MVFDWKGRTLVGYGIYSSDHILNRGKDVQANNWPFNRPALIECWVVAVLLGPNFTSPAALAKWVDRPD